MRSIRPLAPALLLVGAAAVAACSSGGAASPSTAPATTAPSEAPSTAPSSAPSEAPSGSPSSAPSASAAATRVDVVGTDYAFSEFDASFSAPVAFAFRNEGAELHEMVIVRKNDDVTETFQELLALPEDEAFAKVGFVGQTFAEPGQTGPDILTATEPGDYLMVCFIPQGTTSLPSIDPASSAPPEGLGDGPPHFTLGMLREFSITQ